MSGQCLIVDEVHENIHPLLEKAGISYDYHPRISRSEIKEIITDYEGLIIRSKTRVDEELIGKAKLKFVARAGAGVDNLDEAYLEVRGIAIINAPEGNRDAVGEHTIGLMLNLLHNLHQGNHEVKLKEWNREANRGRELSELTVGIIGLGNSGTAVASKLKGFGCRVIAYDKYVEQVNYPEILVDMETLFAEADILSLHIPLTSETRELVTMSFLEQFNKPIYFINVSRGEIAPLAEIRQAMESGKILKAALDVMECEDFAKMQPQQMADFQWLKETGKVIFTPHVAGWSFESYARINEVLVEKIGHFLDKQGK
jgi:D-3-phosphoglycerate dehydrogenase